MSYNTHVNIFPYIDTPKILNVVGNLQETKPIGYSGIKVTTWAQVCDYLDPGKKVNFDIILSISDTPRKEGSQKHLVTRFSFNDTIVPLTEPGGEWKVFQSFFGTLNPDVIAPCLIRCERRNDMPNQDATELWILRHKVDFMP